MSAFQPPPSMSVPIALDSEKKAVRLTQSWHRWFIDLIRVVNASVVGSQPANRVFAGPTAGADAAPAFRALVAADFPGVTAVITTAKLTAGGANGSMTFTNGILTAHVDAT